jgi:hypothetical protein
VSSFQAWAPFVGLARRRAQIELSESLLMSVYFVELIAAQSILPTPVGKDVPVKDAGGKRANRVTQIQPRRL